MIKMMTDCTFSMIPGAIGSYDINKTDKEQVEKLIQENGGCIAYIPDNKMAEVIKKNFDINQLNEYQYPDEFYDTEEFILVKNENKKLSENPIPEYFYCSLHVDWLARDRYENEE